MTCTCAEQVVPVVFRQFQDKLPTTEPSFRTEHELFRTEMPVL